MVNFQQKTENEPIIAKIQPSENHNFIFDFLDSIFYLIHFLKKNFIIFGVLAMFQLTFSIHYFFIIQKKYKSSIKIGTSREFELYQKSPSTYDVYSLNKLIFLRESDTIQHILNEMVMNFDNVSMEDAESYLEDNFTINEGPYGTIEIAFSHRDLQFSVSLLKTFIKKCQEVNKGFLILFNMSMLENLKQQLLEVENEINTQEPLKNNIKKIELNYLIGKKNELISKISSIHYFFESSDSNKIFVIQKPKSKEYTQTTIFQLIINNTVIFLIIVYLSANLGLFWPKVVRRYNLFKENYPKTY